MGKIKERRRRDSPAERRPDDEYQGHRGRRRDSQWIPLTEFSLGLTGDIDEITNAHNLAMVALTARMQHERNYDDEKLARLTGMRRLRHRPHPGGNGLDH